MTRGERRPRLMYSMRSEVGVPGPNSLPMPCCWIPHVLRRDDPTAGDEVRAPSLPACAPGDRVMCAPESIEGDYSTSLTAAVRSYSGVWCRRCTHFHAGVARAAPPPWPPGVPIETGLATSTRTSHLVPRRWVPRLSSERAKDRSRVRTCASIRLYAQMTAAALDSMGSQGKSTSDQPRSMGVRHNWRTWADGAEALLHSRGLHTTSTS